MTISKNLQKCFTELDKILSEEYKLKFKKLVV